MDNRCCNASHMSAINIVIMKKYLAAIKFASSKSGSHKDFNIAGWNDFVHDKHNAARLAYRKWIMHGKPRTCFIHLKCVEHVLF